MKHTERVEAAVTQIRKQLNCKNDLYSPARNKKYWTAVQQAEKEFDVSGIKLDKILQCEL